jgi:hypothetical protein
MRNAIVKPKQQLYSLARSVKTITFAHSQPTIFSWCNAQPSSFGIIGDYPHRRLNYLQKENGRSSLAAGN